jgi:hypothetical protein
MPWVKLWAETAKHACERDEKILWYEDAYVKDEEALKDDAESFADQSRYGHCERITFGFEILNRLPEEARQTLIKKYTQQRTHAEAHLHRLGACSQHCSFCVSARSS